MQFGPKWVGLVVAVLVAAALSGRALYMDGAHHVIASMLHWDWFPQPTPRRFFAVIWNTGLIRLLGIAEPREIDISTLLYALTTFSQLAVPAAILAWAQIRQPLKSILAAAYFSAILILGNFSVTESLFAIALTTIFVGFILDPRGDQRGLLRFLVALLLVASYESVALSNIFLAFSCWYVSRDGGLSRFMRWLLIVTLCIAPVFQVTWYVVNPSPKADIDFFVVELAVLQFVLLLAIATYFKLAGNNSILRYAAIVVTFIGPVALFFLPQSLHVRSDLFRFAYPSRYYGIAAMGFIALFPVLTDGRFWNVPSRLMAWYGTRAANDLGVAMCMLFCGVTALSALDTFSFRTELQRRFAGLSGEIPISRCAFCARPEAFGVADLGYPWTWEEYSMAYDMHTRSRHPVVILIDDTTLAFNKREVDAFIARLKSAN